ncbi:peptidase M48 family protein [Sphingomonas sp. Leaf412]|uniref:M48 family metallopeptidase n=1 Tax=Sphingomonas sp. Leaf412 TaxID=1736370 RepID=UPI0006FF042E|nr:M48 family metallopeptidase [Sphingomonas sp. Leaf412]KQT31975.1 peptidase M48 family protein [Sphingomonas sp. Leaf412]
MIRFLTALALVAASPATAVSPDTAPYEGLRELDTRLARIAYRLVTANVALCREQQPVLGLTLHAIDQYPAADATAVRQVFGFPAPVAVELVVPGGPAAAAGVRADDGVTAIDGVALPVPAPSGDVTAATRDAAQARLAAVAPGTPVALSLRRGSIAQVASVRPVAGCRAEFEVLATTKLGASSDGRVVQVGAPLFLRFDDEQIAVVVAHELAHTILRHRIRLEAAGVKWGLLAQFGRNARLFRETETEADVLGAFLLRNAGWDAQAAVRFWRTQGAKIDGGMFHSRTHPSAKDRAATIERALAAMPAAAPIPYAPAILAQRDAPLQ